MVDWLLNLPSLYGGLLFIAFFAFMSLVGLFLVHHFVDRKKIRASHDIIGFTFTTFGVIYAVLLGFTVVDVQDRYNEVKLKVEQEADLLANLHYDSGVFPNEVSDAIQEGLLDYAQVVLSNEWSKMKSNVIPERSMKSLRYLWDIYYNYTPETAKEEIWYKESIAKLNELNSMRQLRIYYSLGSLNSITWMLLISGGVATICFVYFFVSDSLICQTLLVLMLSACISYMLFLILSIDNVYSGDMGIKPTGFENFYQMFKK